MSFLFDYFFKKSFQWGQTAAKNALCGCPFEFLSFEFLVS
jgi:hypothetical protein